MSLDGRVHATMWSPKHKKQLIGTVARMDRLRKVGSNKEIVILEIKDAVFLPEIKRRGKR